MSITLKIPFAQKDEAKAIAKAAGGRLLWDGTEKLWTWSGKELPSKLTKYVVGPPEVTAKPKAKASSKPRTYVLDVPFHARPIASMEGAVWDAKLKAHTFKGTELPASLLPFKSADFSLERLREEDINSSAEKQFPGSGKIKPRPHQVEAIKAIHNAIKAKRHGILIADDVGLGKTIETAAAVAQLPASIKTVLIVSPLAVVAHWRSTIRELGDGGKRWVVMNYERMNKLFEATEEVKSAKKKRTKNKRLAQKGELEFDFDIVIFDESHRLRNPTSQRSVMAQRLSDDADFTLWLSATAGQNPLELSYLAPLLAQVTGSSVKDLKEFEQWCISQGIGVTRGNYGKWEWSGDTADCEKIRKMLFEGKIPAGIRRRPEDIVGWPEINRVLLPMSLDSEERGLYDKVWTDFRKEMRMVQKGGDPTQGIVAQLRFRQKSSLIRIPSTVELVEELIDNGRRVAISVQFIETMRELKEKLEKKKYSCAIIYGGQSGNEKEAERMRFQTGKAQVVIYTVEEGISLHRTEHDQVDRAAIIHDGRFSAISLAQIEGRCHRDGQRATIYYVFAEDTVEEKIIRTVVKKMISMKNMIGDDTATLKEIEGILNSAAEED